MIDKRRWNKYKFLEIVENVKDKAKPAECGDLPYIGLEHLSSESLSIDKYGSSTEVTGDKIKIEKGDVLFGKRRAYQRKVGIAPFDGIFSAHGMVFRPKPKIIIKELLPFFIKSDVFMNRAVSISVGSLSPTVNWSDLKRMDFFLPPIDQQMHIADILWAANEVIQKQVAINRIIKQIKSIHLNSFSQIAVQGDDLCSLGDLIEFKSGQVDPTITPYKDMPLIAPNHVESCTGKVLKIETAAAQNAISGKYKFSKGEIVYSKIRPNLNKVFIADFDGLCSADMYPLCPAKNIRPKFLYYILSSKAFLEYASACSVRTIIPRLNRQEMSRFKLHCPGLKRQDKFLKRMEQLEDSIGRSDEYITTMHNLSAVLINYYFGGQVDV